jgi:hypothetical protein
LKEYLSLNRQENSFVLEDWERREFLKREKGKNWKDYDLP